MEFKHTPVALKFTFAKMHGAGNDYVYIPLLPPFTSDNDLPDDIPTLARRISDRHFGVGGDGLVIVLHSEVADFRMRMFNADGSEAGMCGNASRCVGKLVYDLGLTDKQEITLETASGIKTLSLHIGTDGTIESVTVDMGIPKTMADEIPAIGEPGKPIINHQLNANGLQLGVTAVNMGNPHGVVFVNTLSDALVHNRGPLLENAPLWPERANIEFVRVDSPSKIEMRVWERGSGETLACGTGACAAVVAGVMRGMTDRNVDVHLPGGVLHIEYDEKSGHVMMTGPATIVATGEYFLTPEPKFEEKDKKHDNGDETAKKGNDR